MMAEKEPGIAPVDPPVDPRVRHVELAISVLLRAGVLTSLAFVMLGTILSFARDPGLMRSREAYARLIANGAEFPHTPAAVWAGVCQFSGPAIVMAGLLLLIGTPVMRVAFSVLAFIYQRDRTFVLITLAVLTLLITSFFLGKAL